MNWKLPTQLRWMASDLERVDPDVLVEAAKEIELLQSVIIKEPVEILIEEGDKANG
jgi:hypothetical protein